MDPLKNKPFDIYMTGLQFFKLASLANEEAHLQEVGFTSSILFPILFNYAHSCELFLKAILAKHGFVPKTHNLEKLFFALPKSVQIKLQIKYQSELTWFLAQLKQTRSSELEFRYYHEERLLPHYTFLTSFAKNLEQIAKEEINI